MTNQFSLICFDKVANKTYTYDGYLEEKKYDGYLEEKEKYFLVYIRDKADYISFFFDKKEDPDKSAVMTNAIQPEGITNNTLLKASLKYLFERFPFLTKVEFRDGVSENGIFITPKRLLLDQPGWYEEHFGAKSYSTLFRIHCFKREMKYMNTDMTKIIDKILDHTWGKLEDYKGEFVNLLISSWNIYKKEVDEYPIDISIHENREVTEPEWFEDAKYAENKVNEIDTICRLLQCDWYHTKREMRENS
jgi:hypothetical protein